MELVFLPELFGFCCFSMRFFVFIDLLGTLVCRDLLCLVFLIIEALMIVLRLDFALHCRLRKSSIALMGTLY